MTTGHALKLSADDYHDKLGAEGALEVSIGQADYLTLLHRQAAFARAARVEYAYTLVQRGGKILFTSDSPTADDFKTDSYAKLGEEYTDAPKGLLLALKDHRLHFDVYTDKWGTFRSAFIPTTSPAGVRYVIGVDIATKFIAAELQSTLKKSLGIGALRLVLGWVAILALCQLMFRPLDLLLTQVNNIAGGDLRRTVEIPGSNMQGKNEIAQLGTQINSMSLALGQMISQVQRSTLRLRMTAHTLSSQTRASVESSQEQLRHVEHASQAAFQMGGEVTSILHDMRQTRAASEDALQTAAASRLVVAQAVANVERAQTQSLAVAKSMHGLDESVGNIEKVISVIREIADQTNLLALNAAIEAARAGEQGRGVAIVAEQVRSLAAKTLKATRQIETTINTVLEETATTTRSVATSTADSREAHACMGEVDSTLSNITTSCTNAHQEIEKVTVLAARQADTAEAIGETLRRSMQSSITASQSVNALAQEATILVKLANDLASTTAKFMTTTAA